MFGHDLQHANFESTQWFTNLNFYRLLGFGLDRPLPSPSSFGAFLKYKKVSSHPKRVRSTVIHFWSCKTIVLINRMYDSLLDLLIFSPNKTWPTSALSFSSCTASAFPSCKAATASSESNQTAKLENIGNPKFKWFKSSGYLMLFPVVTWECEKHGFETLAGRGLSSKSNLWLIEAFSPQIQMVPSLNTMLHDILSLLTQMVQMLLKPFSTVCFVHLCPCLVGGACRIGSNEKVPRTLRGSSFPLDDYLWPHYFDMFVILAYTLSKSSNLPKVALVFLSSPATYKQVWGEPIFSCMTRSNREFIHWNIRFARASRNPESVRSKKQHFQCDYILKCVRLAIQCWSRVPLPSPARLPKAHRSERCADAPWWQNAPEAEQAWIRIREARQRMTMAQRSTTSLTSFEESPNELSHLR